MHRFRSFRWAWDLSAVDLRLRAPLLQRFENREAFYAIPSGFLGGAAGRLHTLCLGDALFPDSCPALATVTHLRASYPGYIDAPLRFERIFALCPQLEVLDLRTIFEHTRVRLPTGPFPPTLKVVKLHAIVDCDLVHLYRAWAHGVSGSLQHVRLKMPLTPAYNVAPFLDGAVEIAMTFAREEHKARIVADLPNARRRILVLYELEQVFEPAAVLARIFRDLTPSTIAGVRSLRVPFSVLHHVLSADLPWPALSRLDVDMFAHDGYDTTPYEFGETYRRFRWSTLDCLRALPAVTALSLMLHSKNPADSPDLEDARELLQYVSVQSTGAFPVARVHGFPADVVRVVDAEAPTHPWVPFVVDGGALL